MPIKYDKGLHKTTSIEVKRSPFWRSVNFCKWRCVFVIQIFIDSLTTRLKETRLFSFGKEKKPIYYTNKDFYLMEENIATIQNIII